MAADFGPLGVRVNAISPGEIDTSILSPGTDKIVETIPMRRLGTTDEVAKAIYFPVYRIELLCQRDRNSHQWRPARLNTGFRQGWARKQHDHDTQSSR